MINKILSKLKESFISIIPIIVIVTIIGLIDKLTPVFNYTDIIDGRLLMTFIICGFILMIGMAFFTFGSEVAMSNAGKYLGASISKIKSVVALIVVIFALGLMITIAEPDLSVLASYINEEDLNPWVLKICIGAGIGIFLVIGAFRIINQRSLRIWIIFFYAIIFGLACLFGGKNGAILEISFDSGGATTGPITVPFLIAFGTGVAQTVSGKNENSDTFGLTGLCSVGPIIIVMILGLITEPQIVATKNEISLGYGKLFADFITSIKDVAIAILPIVAFFLIYELIFIKLKAKEILRILVGFAFTSVGLIIFLTAANYGFIPVGASLGQNITALGNNYLYLLIIISIVIGLVIVLAEPGVQVLSFQVEEISQGTIKRKTMMFALSIGVSLAVFIATVRVIFFPTLSILWIMIPLLTIALALSLYVSDIYVAVAFDSGGVASGCMASCFVLPFILGISSVLDNGSSGFGVIGIIATIPVIAIQALGAYYKFSSFIKYKKARARVREENDDQIIHFIKE